MIFSRVLRDSTPRYVSLLVGLLVGWLVGRLVGPLLGSGPEGADDLCFHTGEISPSPPYVHPFEAHILALRLKSQP